VSEQPRKKLDDFVFSSPENIADPYPFFEALHDEQPVYKVPGSEMYLVSDFADARRVASESAVFSSQLRPPQPEAGAPDPNPMMTAISERARCPIRPGVNEIDPPQHAAIRKLIFSILSPARVREYEPMIEEMVDNLIDGFSATGRVEFMHEFAMKLPMEVICTILGFGPERASDLKRWSDAYSEIRFPGTPEERKEPAIEAVVEFQDFITYQVESRMAEPTDDGIGQILRMKEELGLELELGDMVSYVRALTIAGNEATGHFIGNTMARLMNDPELLATFLDEPKSRMRIMEESLRFETPSQWIMRVTKEDVELSGTKIPRGTLVMAMLGAGNRDEETFACPADFDGTRGNVKDHLAFGHGIHFCIGAPLTRAEGKHAFQALFERLPGIHLAEDGPLEYVEAPRVARGLEHLWLEFEPVPAAAAVA
jgi:cytochrome P450